MTEYKSRLKLVYHSAAAPQSDEDRTDLPKC